jgi:hypothetical protein
MLHKIFQVFKSYHGKRCKMIKNNEQTWMWKETVMAFLLGTLQLFICTD